MMAPGDVEARTKRRQRAGNWWANCWASAPPQDTPSTSICPVCPSRRISLSASDASVENRYGRAGGGDAPTPGTSKMTASGSCSASSSGFTSSRLAPMPLNSSKGGLSGRPWRIPTCSSCPSRSMSRISIGLAASSVVCVLIFLSQQLFVDLAHARLVDCLHENHPPRDRVLGDCALLRELLDVPLQIAFRNRVAVGLLEHDDGHRPLAPFLVLDSDDGHFTHGIVPRQNALQVERRDPLAARLDHVLDPIG